MKKVLFGLCILSTLAFGKFEKQFGYTKLDDSTEKVTILQNSKNQDCILAIIKYENAVTVKQFYDFIEDTMEGEEYEILDSSNIHALISAVDYFPVLIINNKDSIISIDIPTSNHLKVAMGYLKANEISTSSTNLVISDISLNIILDELKKQ
ncbi:MAG: hypothetical protein ACRCXT_00220 [Paraclostridium sp.]